VPAVSSVSIADVYAAAKRLAPYVHRTPILRSTALNRMFECSIAFKAEHLQKVGAFKARGACNAVFSLSHEEARYGVATHSSGNHAQALAYAAALRGIPCTIVMPNTAPSVKKAAVCGYGASIVECKPSLADRESTLAALVSEHGYHVVHPYNDVRVIAGQGTAALELLEDEPDLDIVMAPVGGGGLISGTAVVCRSVSSSIDVIGAEPSIADDARQSLETGVIQPAPSRVTIADGLRTALGPITMQHLVQNKVRILTASEDSIREGMYLLMERLKQVVEPSAAVTLGVLLENPSLVVGKRVGIILCGGNLDVRKMLSLERV